MKRFATLWIILVAVLVMIFSFFLFHEKFTGRKVLALVMTFAGCVLVTGVLDQQNMVSPMGILTGLGAGLGYALYSIFGRYALERGYQSFTITFYTFFIAFIGTLFLTDIRPVMRVACQDVPSVLVSLGLGVILVIVH